MTKLIVLFFKAEMDLGFLCFSLRVMTISMMCFGPQIYLQQWLLGRVICAITEKAQRIVPVKIGVVTFGDHLDFMAPGVKIATTDMLGANGFTTNALTLTFNGTSAACPNAAGVGALVLSANPNLTNEQVRQILSWTAEKVTYGYDSLAVLGSWDIEAGYGRLNAHQAIVLAMNTNELTAENETPLITIGANPSDVLEVKNISGAIQEVQWVDALGRTMSAVLQPGETLKKELAKGIYCITCNRQHVNVMIY